MGHLQTQVPHSESSLTQVLSHKVIGYCLSQYLKEVYFIYIDETISSRPSSVWDIQQSRNRTAYAIYLSDLCKIT